MTQRCFSCKSTNTIEEGETHKYLLSSPSCWAKYGLILEREYSNEAYFKAHRLTVDAYALQHPGKENPQTIQSSIVHLASLYLIFEAKLSHKEARIKMSELTQLKDRFIWLMPPQKISTLNVDDILRASTPEEHFTLVKKWAFGVYQCWIKHIPYIKSLLTKSSN